jgi:hypothetical protein
MQLCCAPFDALNSLPLISQKSSAISKILGENNGLKKKIAQRQSEKI